MQYVFELGVAAGLGGGVVTFLAWLMKDLKRTSYGFMLMALGLIMMIIELKEYISSIIVAFYVLVILFFIFMAGYKYLGSRKQEKGGAHA